MHDEVVGRMVEVAQNEKKSGLTCSKRQRAYYKQAFEPFKNAQTKRGEKAVWPRYFVKKGSTRGNKRAKGPSPQTTKIRLSRSKRNADTIERNVKTSSRVGEQKLSQRAHNVRNKTEEACQRV